MKGKAEYIKQISSRGRGTWPCLFFEDMQENNQIFEEAFRGRERGKVEDNKEVYV